MSPMILLFATAQAANDTPIDAQLGDRCDPGQEAFRSGVECLPAYDANGDPLWNYYPMHIPNAEEGDALLSSANGLLLNLMEALDQDYTHTGMMIDNGYNLTHATFFKDYLTSEGNLRDGGANGLQTDALRYGWPGTIQQTVDEAYEGTWMLAPDGVDYFNIGFSDGRCTNGGTVLDIDSDGDGIPEDRRCMGAGGDLIPPLVAKPPVDVTADWYATHEDAPGTWPHRQALRQAAQEAEDTRGHYRFFGFTVGVVESGNPDPFHWAHETDVGLVCSSYVWRSLTLAGFDFEGAAIEAEDVGKVDIDCAPEDGLYCYPESRRRQGGEVLHELFHSTVYENAGFWGELFSDASDDTANQVVNCFSHDWCGEEAPPTACSGEGNESKDSECWEDPGDGTALSPDDILHWDMAEDGPYGHWEPAQIMPAKYRRETTWQVAPHHAEMSGWVEDRNGVPLPNVEVHYGQVASHFTDSQYGSFRLNFPSNGSEVLLEACYQDGQGQYWRGEQKVTPALGHPLVIPVIVLDQPVNSLWNCQEPPADVELDFFVDVDMTIVDSEWAADDEIAHFSYRSSGGALTTTGPDEPLTVDLFDSDSLTQWIGLSQGHGGEMMIDLDVTLLYVPSTDDPLRGTMRVGYSADLWEGTDEGRNDLDGQTRDGHADDLVITDPALPGHVVIPFSVRNVEEDADDTASGTITVSYVP